MNNFRLQHVTFLLGVCILLGAGPVPTAPEKIPPDKVVHPLVPPVMPPEVIPETRKDPVYPEKWRKLHLGARVILQCVIGESGSVAECDPVKTGLHDEADCGKDPEEWPDRKEPGNRVGPPEAARDFETAAIEAVKEWKFRPALENGKPVKVFSTLIVNFTLCPKKTDPQPPPHR